MNVKGKKGAQSLFYCSPIFIIIVPFCTTGGCRVTHGRSWDVLHLIYVLMMREQVEKSD